MSANAVQAKAYKNPYVQWAMNTRLDCVPMLRPADVRVSFAPIPHKPDRRHPRTLVIGLPMHGGISWQEAFVDSQFVDLSAAEIRQGVSPWREHCNLRFRYYGHDRRKPEFMYSRCRAGHGMRTDTIKMEIKRVVALLSEIQFALDNPQW